MHHQIPLICDEAGGREGWPGGRQAEMVEDGFHRHGPSEIGEHHAAAATRAGEHVFAEDAHQQLGPGMRDGFAARWTLAVA